MPTSMKVVSGLYGVRYQVKDVARAIEFYTQKLGFKLDRKHLPAFGQVSIGDFKLMLSGPGASDSRPMPDGRAQEPGSWSNEIESGPGGKQIQLLDPDGNPLELFEPAR